MIAARSPRLLLVLLIASIVANVWQFLSTPPEAEVRKQIAVVRPVSGSQPVAGRLSGKKPGVAPDDEATAEQNAKPIAAKPPAEQQSEDELIYGASGADGKILHFGEVNATVSPQRLKELAKMPVSQAERFQVHARLHLPGGRTADLGTVELKAGHRMKFERIKEFPFPVGVSFAHMNAASPFEPLGESSPPEESSFPITPTTPAEFEFKNTGLEVELDMTPAPGSIVLGGCIRQTVFDGFGRMPGEAFSPVMEGDVVLTENKVLQPQFTTRESPFVAAAAEGQPVRVPVHTSFGQTILELTCTPLE